MSEAMTMYDRMFDNSKRCPFTGDFIDNFHFYFLNAIQGMPQPKKEAAYIEVEAQQFLPFAGAEFRK